MIPVGKAHGVTVGIVIEREFGGLGRVRLRLPAMNDRETDWVRVAVPYGGKTKDGKAFGHQWVPEENSEVVVAFYQEDPKVPLVLGSIYSRERPPPSSDPDEHILQSRRGDVVVLSDQKGKERFEVRTVEGQVLKIDAATKTISLENDHRITLSGDGKQITLQTGGGIRLVLNDSDGSATLSASSVSIAAGSIELKKA